MSAVRSHVVCRDPERGSFGVPVSAASKPQARRCDENLSKLEAFDTETSLQSNCLNPSPCALHSIPRKSFAYITLWVWERGTSLEFLFERAPLSAGSNSPHRAATVARPKLKTPRSRVSWLVAKLATSSCGFYGQLGLRNMKPLGLACARVSGLNLSALPPSPRRCRLYQIV